MYRARLTPDSTYQEVYNHLVAAFKAGSFPSAHSDPSNVRCYYRQGDRACHIGIFIPDENYSKSFEAFTLDKLLEVLRNQPVPLLPPWFSDSFAFDLQQAHDDLTSFMKAFSDIEAQEAYFRKNWRDRVREVFKDYGFSVVDE